MAHFFKKMYVTFLEPESVKNSRLKSFLCLSTSVSQEACQPVSQEGVDKTAQAWKRN